MVNFVCLRIPSVKDRIVQILFYFAVDPIAEKTACKRSYGYRLHRSVHNNATYLKLVLGAYIVTRRYLLKADIKGFFPSVKYNWLLENVIMDRRILNEFLKAGSWKTMFSMELMKVFLREAPFLHRWLI